MTGHLRKWCMCGGSIDVRASPASVADHVVATWVALHAAEGCYATSSDPVQGARWRRRARAAERRRGEQGAVLLYMLLLVPFVLFFVGMGVDLFRLVGAERALATAVDASAEAGGSGVDEAEWREYDRLRLDPALAESLARDNLSAQPEASDLEGVSITATPERVVVRATMPVHLSLLTIFVNDNLTVQASGTATPRRGP